MKFITPDNDWWLALQERDLPLTFDGIEIRFLQDDNGGKLRMMIEIGENTPIESIVKNRQKIKEWRKRLLAHQGAWKDATQMQLYNLWLAKEVGGKSYQQIADELNHHIEVSLQLQVSTIQLVIEAGRTFHLRSFDDAVAFVQGRNKWLGGFSDGYDRAYDMLKVMGFSDEDAEAWCKEGMLRLYDGKPAFPGSGTPIDRWRVRERVRIWDERKERPDKT